MSPRIIHIPLSGGDRKAQAKGIGYAHGIHESAYRELVLIRSAAEAKIREADPLECEAWNAIMWAGPAMPSPGDPQAEPTRMSNLPIKMIGRVHGPPYPNKILISTL